LKIYFHGTKYEETKKSSIFYCTNLKTSNKYWKILLRKNPT